MDENRVYWHYHYSVFFPYLQMKCSCHQFSRKYPTLTALSQYKVACTCTKYASIIIVYSPNSYQSCYHKDHPLPQNLSLNFISIPIFSLLCYLLSINQQQLPDYHCTYLSYYYYFSFPSFTRKSVIIREHFLSAIYHN